MGSEVAVQSRASSKWLNIVLDLNGVLCQCIERSTAIQRGRTFIPEQHTYSSKYPTIIGPKGVFCRPRVREFLDSISEFARIVVWSSMKRSTVSAISNYLFHDLPTPLAILGQDHCQTIDIGEGRSLFRGNENKLIYLKIMPQQLFSSRAESWPFNTDNTILIDDSPETSVCNDSGNALFLDTWSRDRMDFNYLVDTLAPWLRELNDACLPGELRNYVKENRIGIAPMSPDDPLLSHMMRGMALSSKNVGVHYDIIGVPGLYGS